MSDPERTAPRKPSSGDAPDAARPEVLAGRFQALWESSPDGLILLDSSGTVVDCNPTAASGLGFVAGAPFTGHFPDPIAAEDAISTRSSLALTGGLELADGRLVLVASCPIAEGPESGHRLVQVRDVSCTRAMEQELADVRRFALVGQLAASIANAINNPLAVILGRIELFSELGASDPISLPAHLAVIAEHAQRIAGIVDALLSFSRPAEGARERIRLIDLLNTARRASGQRTAGMRLELRIDGGLRVFGHRVQLEQVMATLLAYAGEALHRRGSLTVQAEAQGDICVVGFYGAGHAALPPRLREMLETGVLAREATSSGMSFGILSAANLLRQSRGRLQVLASGAGEPLFQVELPMTEGPIQQGGPWQVLAVDSDGALFDELRRAAVGLDMVIAEARDTAEALSALVRLAPHVIVSTPTLADGGGLQLRNAVAQRWPGMAARVVIAVSPSHWAMPCIPALRRPVQAEQLLHAVRSLSETG